MKKEEIKQILLNMGISKKFIEMPAVMERIYYYFQKNNSVEEIVNKLEIQDNGQKIVIDGNKIFEKTEEGASFTNIDQNDQYRKGKFIIDEYGMDKSFSDDEELALMGQNIYAYRTENRKIKVCHGGKGTLEEDHGEAIINYYNYTVLESGKTTSLEWEENKKFLTENYPITKEWFEEREVENEQEEEHKQEKREETNTEENEVDIENMRKIINVLQNKNDELKRENEQLETKNGRLQEMLSRTLDLCQDVKRSTFGRIFFGKQIKRLPEISKEDETLR